MHRRIFIGSDILHLTYLHICDIPNGDRVEFKTARLCSLNYVLRVFCCDDQAGILVFPRNMRRVEHFMEQNMSTPFSYVDREPVHC